MANISERLPPPIAATPIGARGGLVGATLLQTQPEPCQTEHVPVSLPLYRTTKCQRTLFEPEGRFVNWVMAGSIDYGGNCGEILGYIACPHSTLNKFLIQNQKEPHERGLVPYLEKQECKTKPTVMKRICWRALCHICYKEVANREANNAYERLQQGKELYKIERIFIGNAKHIVISPPHRIHAEMETVEGFKKVMTDTYSIIKRTGILGGILIIHSHRGSAKEGWEFSPHFHIVGFGYVKNLPNRLGWIIKNIGYRKSIKATIRYLLTHHGIALNTEHKELEKRMLYSVRWFGKFSYNKLIKKVEKTELKPLICEYCGIDLHHYKKGLKGEFEDSGEVSYTAEKLIIYALRKAGLPPPGELAGVYLARAKGGVWVSERAFTLA